MNIKTTSPLKFSESVDTRTNMFKRFLSVLFSKLDTRLKAFRKSRIDRRAIMSLLKLSNKELRDIGVSRADIIWASKLPRDQIATYELQKRVRAKHY